MDEKIIDDLVSDYAAACASSFDIDTVESMIEGFYQGLLKGYKIGKEKYIKESIDEEKLEMLAISECGKMLEPIDVNGYDYVSLGDAEDCFIAGYKKAIEK